MAEVYKKGPLLTKRASLPRAGLTRHAIEVSRQGRAAGITCVATRQLAARILVALALPPASLSISLTNDAAMRALNGAWRGKDRVTDVLSFPGGFASGPPAPEGLAQNLGDIALCVPQAQRQAEAHGHPLMHEVCVLLVHAVLHLLGHDHEHGGRQARNMREAEAALLAKVADHAGGSGALLQRSRRP